MNIIAVYEKAQSLMTLSQYDQESDIGNDKFDNQELQLLEQNLRDYEGSDMRVFYVGYDLLTSDLLGGQIIDTSILNRDWENSHFIVTKNFQSNDILKQLKLSFLVQEPSDIDDLENMTDIEYVINITGINDSRLSQYQVINLDIDQCQTVLIKQ